MCTSENTIKIKTKQRIVPKSVVKKVKVQRKFYQSKQITVVVFTIYNVAMAIINNTPIQSTRNSILMKQNKKCYLQYYNQCVTEWFSNGF